jgi:UDP-3-O-acyl N-acetylglucosamine deacetylase
MTNNQRTIKAKAVIEGIGAFTGDNVRVEIHPADIDSGPSFELDHEGKVTTIPVAVENIIETENRTVLADLTDQTRQVNFVEHVLGALHGLGIDNATVRVNSVEIPLFDGSAVPFINAIDKAGIVEQDAARREIVIEKPIFIDDNGLLMVLPSDTLKLAYYLDQPDDYAGKRLARIDATPENFRRRIGASRTFINAEKAKDLIASGAVKHADESQVLIVHKDHISQPLRFANEFCYHKMLDILGDLYLTGRRLRAQVIGVRSGHYQNRKMIRKIAEEYK